MGKKSKGSKGKGKGCRVAVALTLTLMVAGCAGTQVTASTALSQLSRAIDAAMAAYHSFCGGEHALAPECLAMSEALGNAMQQRGQLAVTVEAQP